MTYYTNQQIMMFFAVAEHRNLSEAARAMFVSQPSLSKTLARLEDNLAVKLFERAPDGMKLTREGEYLYSNFKTCFNQIAVAIDRAREMQLSGDRILRVGMYHTAGFSSDFTVAKKIVSEFESLYPEVSVFVEYMSFYDIRHHLLNGDIDIGFSLSYALKNMIDVEKRAINRLTWGIAVPQDQFSDDDKLALERLEQMTMLGMSPEETQIDKTLYYERCMQFGFKPKNIMFLQNTISVLEAVKKGQGFTFFGHPLEPYRDLFADGIKYYPLPSPPGASYITAVWRCQNMSRELRDVVEMLPKEHAL